MSLLGSPWLVVSLDRESPLASGQLAHTKCCLTKPSRRPGASIPAPTPKVSDVAGITWTDWDGDGSLVVVDVALACCALEYEAAAGLRANHLDLAAAPAGAHYAVIVSGTVTDRLAPAVLSVIDACRQRDPECRVISFGACAASGGPYWDSYAVTKGIGQLIEVDAYVAGCPPPPDALEQALNPRSSRSPSPATGTP